ncbi:LLM class flavin-dependent oxidoreductase [Peribacillus cavernae]|uniref:LLM class flavin-dependent oxidoreductase n=1 Tax=Peribacillus cavernae TaxID=1674310 RepID=A0A3S0VLD4_9BACI|nr:luciferase family oxidoreductase group 1 [Peribacillus cavernae]RUQ30176.1 LLM class flavin-dependent oxidoreductase [Peribacillus cavernae]
MQLSVLDQSPISKGSDAHAALQQTLQLAMTTEQLGFTRFWVAEHHNTNGLASSSPEILISHIASHTKTIRVGSGGVLLPQYSPYKVAENFKTLEALFPGRIDLGIGRSPGGATATRLALTDSIRKSMNEFPRQLKDLQGFLHDSLPAGHPFEEVMAAPLSDTQPEMWLLGISHRGARVAAENGTSFTYGHFISPGEGRRAAEEYFTKFQPSLSLSQPKMNVCIFVVCAETQEEAEELAVSQDIWLLNVGKGKDTQIPSVSETKEVPLSDEDKRIIRNNRRRAIIGTPEKVKEELLLLKEVYGTDEFMIITNIYDFEAKLRSYHLLADAFKLNKKG